MTSVMSNLMDKPDLTKINLTFWSKNIGFLIEKLGLSHDKPSFLIETLGLSMKK